MSSFLTQHAKYILTASGGAFIYHYSLYIIHFDPGGCGTICGQAAASQGRSEGGEEEGGDAEEGGDEEGGRGGGEQQAD